MVWMTTTREAQFAWASSGQCLVPSSNGEVSAGAMIALVTVAEVRRLDSNGPRQRDGDLTAVFNLARGEPIRA